MLTVYIDFKCPASYLALAPTRTLIETYRINAVWRGSRAYERELPTEGAAPELIAAHERTRTLAERKTHEKYARIQGLDLNFPPHRGSTDLALIALNVLGTNDLSFVESAFEQYWVHHKNLDDTATVEAILTDAGTPLPDSLDALRARLNLGLCDEEISGLVDTPTFEILGQRFVGRQHFPWIREILEGQ